MIRRPPRSTRTDTLFPYTTLFRPARLIRHLHTALIIALVGLLAGAVGPGARSEEHTSELQSLRRISSAVFCLKKKKKTQQETWCVLIENVEKKQRTENRA